MPSITVRIDGRDVSVSEGTTILEACRAAGIRIPTLCYHPDLSIAGNCRVCVVEVDGWQTLTAACVTPVTPGLSIRTNSARVRRARRAVMELLLASHDSNCPECVRNGNCELQELAEDLGIQRNRFDTTERPRSAEEASSAVMRDLSKCILCTRCVRTCEELQSVAVVKPVERSRDVYIGTFMDAGLDGVSCTMCGQCIDRCPVGALYEKTDVDSVWNALEDPDRYVVVQTAPAVRVGLAEALGFPVARSTGKMVAALRRLGFDSVLDTDFTADLTIIEEGNELLSRLRSSFAGTAEEESVARLPMMTSCSPGWIKFVEHEFPELIPNLSSCKSPQQMFGSLAKTYLADRIGVRPEEMVCVSVMPCTAKKFESERPEMSHDGRKDVDLVITTRELARMIREQGLDWEALPDESFDRWMGVSTGAGAIFGVTGGVMEAALRTAYEVATGTEVPFGNLRISPVRGMEGIREASITMPDRMAPGWEFLSGLTIRVAVAHGLTNARQLMEAVRSGEADYGFIEVMTCPGGCLGGGGQPIPTDADIRARRASAIYQEDEALTLRKSHENPEVQRLYEDFLGAPLGHKSHELLHTRYTDRSGAGDEEE
jgi:iron-only hydrogenase group A